MSEIEFDWDASNTKHLAIHSVTPTEFEQVLHNNPLDLNFSVVEDEERYRVIGLTDSGRLLSLVFTVRKERIRGITAFPASVSDKKAFLRSLR